MKPVDLCVYAVGELKTQIASERKRPCRLITSVRL